MAVAEIEESAGGIHGQLEGGAFHDLIEIHVAAPAARIAAAGRRLSGTRGDADASQHGPQGHGVMRQVLARLFQRGDAALRVKMPPHILPTVLHLYRRIAIDSSIDNAIVADGLIAIQPEVRQMHHQGIARSCRLDEEGSGLRIPT